jgi:hypothetical protein
MTPQQQRVRDKLLQDYPAEHVGTWQIYGEDPNCDFGGPHSNPHLKTFEGRYVDAVAHAITLSGFWTWGAGGYLKLGAIEKPEPVVLRRKGPTFKGVEFPSPEDLRWRQTGTKDSYFLDDLYVYTGIVGAGHPARIMVSSVRFGSHADALKYYNEIEESFAARARAVEERQKQQALDKIRAMMKNPRF